MTATIERAPDAASVRGIALGAILEPPLFAWVEDYARSRGLTKSKAGRELLLIAKEAVLKGN